MIHTCDAIWYSNFFQTGTIEKNTLPHACYTVWNRNFRYILAEGKDRISNMDNTFGYDDFC